MENREIEYRKRTEEVNSRLEEGFKSKIGGVSSTFEIPENIISLEGIEYLLKLNTFNEVPSVLTYVAPYLMEYRVLAKTDEYSEAKKEAYVEKGTELIERLLSLYNAMNVDLANAVEIDLKHNTDLYKCSKWFIEALASEIGKSEQYNFN